MHILSTNIIWTIYRLFFGDIYPLNISSIRIQETSSNLEKLVKPITTLDQIISNNVYSGNIIKDNPGSFSMVSSLFGYYLSRSLVEKVVCNTYILKSFQCFVNNKQAIRVCLDNLDFYCSNKGLLGLLFSKLVRKTSVKEKDQNLLKRDALKVFNNVNNLEIWCHLYSFCLSSFLSVIDGTKVNKVDIIGNNWLPSIASSSSFNFICTQYEKANFKLEYTHGHLIISKNSV